MEEALQLIDLQSEKQIYCKLVPQIIPGKDRHRIVFIVTESFIHVVLPRTEDKGPQVAAKF
jgi:hypothetical protein